MINSSSVRFRRLFLCAFIDCLAFGDDFIVVFFISGFYLAALILYLYDIGFYLVIRSFVDGFRCWR